MLFINPATEQFGGILSRYVPVGIPVALGNLAAYLMKFGHKVNMVDDEIQKIDESTIREAIKDLPKPYVFGITVLTAQAGRAYGIAKMLREMYPDCTIIMGGIHVTAMPNEALDNGADVVVRGEGELILKKLYESIRSGNKDFSQIKGITYKNAEGKVISEEDDLLLEDLDEIPVFPYEMFTHPKYDMGFITSARGCPYKCAYCSQRVMTGLTYRYKSPQRIVEELDILINQFGQKHIIFFDDNFSFKKKRVIELCDAIVESGLHKKCGFFIQTRADNLYEDIMPYLKKANFTGVGYGMETGVERVAKEIVKDETVETHVKAIKLARKWGLDVSVFMIYGLPTETREDRRESYRLVKELGLRFTKFNNLIPYPGTRLYNRAKNTGEMHIEPFWTNFNSTLTATRSIFDPTPLPFVPHGTTAWQLKRDIMRSNFSFYFAPKTLLSVFLRKAGPGFVMLPKYWFVKPRELFTMAKIGTTLMVNLGVALMPEKMGKLLNDLINSMRERKTKPLNELPQAIDGTMRNIKINRKPRAEATV